MSESDLLSNEQIDGLDGLENGQDGDTIMQCDGVKRDFNEANIDDPVRYLKINIFLKLYSPCLWDYFLYIVDLRLNCK